MTAWLLPLAAAGLWIGMFVSAPVARVVPAFASVCFGFTLLLVAALAAAQKVHGPGLLRVAGLEPVPAEAVQEISAPRRRAGRGPPIIVAASILVGSLALGAGWMGIRADGLSTSALARLAPARVTAVGDLRTDPAASQFGWSATLTVTEVTTDQGAFALHQQIWIEADTSLPSAMRGDRIEVEGALEVPPDGFGDYLRSRGVAVSLQIDRLRPLGPPSNPVVRFASNVRTEIRSAMDAMFAPKEAGLLLGLALGDTSELDPGTERDFQATGLTHLLAVSGGNVAMVLAPVFGLALVLRVRSSVRLIAGLLTVMFFVILTGGEPSVLRAGVMVVFTLSGALLGRRGAAWGILGASVLVLLVLDPFLSGSVGFQLSVGATAGIVTFAAPIAGRLRWLPRPLAAAVATTLAAQLGVGPLLLAYFHWIPGVSVLANVLAFPIVEPAMLLGLAAALLHPVAGGFAMLLARVDLWFLRLLEGLADRMATAPLPSLTSSGGWPPLVAGASVIAGAVWLLRTPAGPVRRRMTFVAVPAMCLVLPVIAWTSAVGAGPPSGLTVHFFDVGQGDGALVQTPEGANVLIDAGPDPDEVAVKLAALGVKRLDVVVATHPHADHIEGLPQVFARFPIGLVLEPGCDEPSPSYTSFLSAVRDEALTVRHPRTGDEIDVGALRLQVLAPDSCFSGTHSDPNNDSVVLRVIYHDDAVLFPGDAEVESQQQMLDEGAALAVPVLKVPHHGGNTSLPEFFDAVSPELSIISVGDPNDYGHPTAEVLAEVASTGSRMLRTDRSGDVTVDFTPEGITVESAA